MSKHSRVVSVFLDSGSNGNFISQLTLSSPMVKLANLISVNAHLLSEVETRAMEEYVAEAL